jgi:hypothetical protein
MIQVTPQMRILVAIEAVDGRKYAPSTNMQSWCSLGPKSGPLRGTGRRITVLLLASKHGQQFVRRPEVTASEGR